MISLQSKKIVPGVFIVVCALLLVEGCAHFYKAPPFNQQEIQKYCNVGKGEDAALLANALCAIDARFIEQGDVSSVFNKEGKPLLEAKAGVTRGMAQIVVDAELIDPPSQPERVKPVFASLAPEVQRELISTCRCGNDTNNIKNVLNILTDQKKSGLRDYYSPEYNFSIASDVTTGSPYDRFDEIVTLIVLDGYSTNYADIAKVASVIDSELTVNYGKLEREETRRMRLMASTGLSVPVASVASASISGEFEGSFREKLIRDLSEKILTTSTFALNYKGLTSKDGLWVVQRGHRDHKLRHTLAQKIQLSLSPVNNRVVSLWGIRGENSARKLELNKWVHPIADGLGVHVFSVGTVRKIDSEKKGIKFWNEKHTPEDGDDKISQYVVTSYQHIQLPSPSKHQYVVDYLDSENKFALFAIKESGSNYYQPACFETLKDANSFKSEVEKVVWKYTEQPAVENGHKTYSATNNILGAIVKVESESASMNGVLTVRVVDPFAEKIDLSELELH